MNISALIRSLLAGLVLGATALPASAQAWPTKPLTMIVPWPAGGPSDFVARKLQPDMAKALGQPVVIDNIGGAGGAIGIQKNVSAAADGYTVSLASPLELIVAPLTLAAVKYKPEELKIVGQIVKAPLVLLARKDLPANTVDELIALTTQPGAKELSVGNGGNGSLFHLVAEKFGQQTGAKFVHVPYKGTTPMMTELMGGQVDMAFTIFAGNIPAMIAEGKVKVLGLATRTPLPKFPQIAALAAHPRLSGFEFDSWAAVVVPRNTPDAVASRINKAVYDALQNPETRAAFEATGNLIVNPTSVADLDRVYRDEVARYQAIARSINFQPQ
jgi:tripartite-type tricarboxylate transporter receptor subunit TctC